MPTPEELISYFESSAANFYGAEEEVSDAALKEAREELLAAIPDCPPGHVLVAVPVPKRPDECECGCNVLIPEHGAPYVKRRYCYFPTVRGLRCWFNDGSFPSWCPLKAGVSHEL